MKAKHDNNSKGAGRGREVRVGYMEGLVKFEDRLCTKDVVHVPSRSHRAQELCHSSGGGRPGLPSLINFRFLWT